MAIWQFDFFIVKNDKKKAFQKDYSENVEEVISWKGFSVSEESILDLSHVLNAEKSWSKDILQFGKIEETCLKLLYEDNIVIEIACRIDVRKLSSVEIDSVIQFIKNNDATIFSDEKFYDVSKENLLWLIQNSKAYEFCKNPIEFLAKKASYSESFYPKE